MGLILAAAPLLAMWAQIAAIIICLFVLISVLLTLAFNLAMTYALAWLREKAEILKLLRPTVDSLNKTAEAASRGVAPSEKENAVVRAVARIPQSVQAADQKVEATADRVANAVIEFRARTMQAKMVVKAFLAPGLLKPRQKQAGVDGLEFQSPGYRTLMEKKVAEIPVEAPGDGYQHDVSSSQLREDVPAR
jgi:hypothetical protein